MREKQEEGPRSEAIYKENEKYISNLHGVIDKFISEAANIEKQQAGFSKALNQKCEIQKVQYSGEEESLKESLNKAFEGIDKLEDTLAIPGLTEVNLDLYLDFLQFY